jgi:hypothetical protein
MDEFGNLRSCGNDNVHVVVLGPSIADPSVICCGDGTYSVGYTITRSGAYELDVRLQTASIASFPFAQIVLPSATDAASSTVDTAFPLSVLAGQLVSFSIDSYDAHQNRRRSGGDNATVRPNPARGFRLFGCLRCGCFHAD